MTKTAVQKLSPWQIEQPELQRLLSTLFQVDAEATEEELLNAGRNFVKALAPKLTNNATEAAMLLALQAQLEDLQIAAMSASDKVVCRQLGIDPREFVRTSKK
jgi:hypothetical protein